MREEHCCRERICISDNGHFFKLKLVEAEIGQLLIISISEGMINEIMCLMCILQIITSLRQIIK